jgi:cytochrome bd-type quinol oxidase subunit 2
MSTQLATEVSTRARRSARVYVLSLLGPLTAACGIAWALLQPYRVTLLHPHGQGFWWLFVEPPLLVVLVGLLFHFLVVPGLVEDLEERR